MRKAVLVAASYAKGGVEEWLEMSSDEFLLWLGDLKELIKDVER